VRWKVSRVVPVVCGLAFGCAAPSVGVQRASSEPALKSLARGDFQAAEDRSNAVLRSDPGEPRARLVRAIARYERAMHRLGLDLRTIVGGGAVFGVVNHRFLKSALEESEDALAEIDRDLEVAAGDEDLAVELCVACWRVDWNGNGRVDERDRLLFQVEQDAEGNPIPEDDPRRTPMFRFDHGDVLWARAFVAFQRAAVGVFLAYDWEAADRTIAKLEGRPREIRIRLTSPERMRKARDLVLSGLRFSNESREAYLTERDDDREWLPNPRQKSHPLPLPVDAALYETWAGVTRDLERIVRGEEGLSAAELARLAEPSSKSRLRGYLDVGRMFSHPGDIVVDVEEISKLRHEAPADRSLGRIFGDNYRRGMKPSPLLARLLRMKAEIDRGQEPLERKLRYLFWIN
jgi:hypothetical protein